MTQEVVLGWMDPSINSRNTGDEIIADSVELELKRLCPNAVVLRIPTQTWLSRKERKLLEVCQHFLVGGTNILNGNIPQYMQWKLDPHLLRAIAGRTSLLGVGWWQYNNEPSKLSSAIWRSVLGNGVHSIRDQYTVEVLSRIGIASHYTACVTMWQLPDKIEFTQDAPSKVLTTVTDYHRDPVRDSMLLKGLRERYDDVVAWPQSKRDEDYLRSLDRGIGILEPGLQSFNEALESGSYDFVGTRLHAGIRALQLGVKATIVAVDNRAPEISKTTGLPVITRQLTPADWRAVEDRSPLSLNIPRKYIDAWRYEFLRRISGLNQ